MNFESSVAWFARTCLFPLVDREGLPRTRLLADLLRSQWLTRESLSQIQRVRLAALLRHAMATVPYYQEAYAGRLSSIEADTIAGGFESLPILSKKNIQSQGKALLSTAVPSSRLRTSKTGGSTGTSLTVHFDVECEAHRVAAAWRSDGWAGWQLGGSRAALWGSPPVPQTAREHLRARLYDRTYYLDTLHLSPESMLAFYATYNRRTPSTLFGHSHSLYTFARFLQSQGLRPKPPAGIVSTSMMLMRHEREMIEAVFAAKVFDRYGCEEVGLIAAECEQHRGLHVNADHLIVEILDQTGETVRSGVAGRVVVTDLMNYGMPLIRYDVGDVAAWGDAPCRCGRGAALISHLVGRTADFLIRADGSLVAGVSLIEKTLTALPGILQMQLEQNDLLAVDVRIVTDSAYDERSASRLLQELRAAFGPSTVFKVQRVDAIAPTGRGKYRFAICNVSRPESPRHA